MLPMHVHDHLSLLRSQPATGAAHRPRGRHSTRSHLGQRRNIDHRLRRWAISPSTLLEQAVSLSSPAATHDKAHLEAEVRKAHVICVVYSIDLPQSFDRIPAYWLPYLRSLGVNVCHPPFLFSAQPDRPSLPGPCDIGW